MTPRKTAHPKRKPLSRKDAVTAVRMARKAGGSTRRPSKTWKKGGREYAKVLGHFGL